MVGSKEAFIDVEEVREVLSIGKTKAYAIIKSYNRELAAKGFLTIRGRCPRKYFEQKIYGYADYYNNGNEKYGEKGIRDEKMAKDNLITNTFRLNMNNPTHVKINNVLKNLNPKIYKSRNQFLIDAAVFFIEHYGDESFMERKEDDEIHFVTQDEFHSNDLGRSSKIWLIT